MTSLRALLNVSRVSASLERVSNRLYNASAAAVSVDSEQLATMFTQQVVVKHSSVGELDLSTPSPQLKTAFSGRCGVCNMAANTCDVCKQGYTSSFVVLTELDCAPLPPTLL